MVGVGVPLPLCGPIAHRILGHGFARISTDLNLWLNRVQRLVQIIEDIVNIFDSY